MQGHASQGGDYQKYMKQYSGDYQKYMQGHASQGGDYQKYMQGQDSGSTDSESAEPSLLAAAPPAESHPSGASHGTADENHFMQKFAKDGPGFLGW